jgi:hypothetical protein
MVVSPGETSLGRGYIEAYNPVRVVHDFGFK